MKRIFKYVFIDILRNKFVPGYALLLAGISCLLFLMEDNPAKAMLSLLNITLVIVPLVSVIFSTTYLYNAASFVELLVSQPVKRIRLLFSIFAAIASSLALAVTIGIVLPVILFKPDAAGLTLSCSAIITSFIFSALALLASVATRDKAKGIGLSLLLWLFFSLIYDGIVMFLLFQLADYPIESLLIALSMLNPIDLVRILLLLQLDISAMMGMTEAVFKSFFGSAMGMTLTAFMLLLWIILPSWLALYIFNRKDL